MKKLQEWFFAPQAATSLALFRIVVCGLAFFGVLVNCLNFEAFFTEKGLYPAEFATRWGGETPRLNLLSGVTDARITGAMLLVCALAALLGCLGIFTRWSIGVLFITLVSMHHRNPDILNSGDTLLRQWVFFLMISPCGQALSVDNWRKGLGPQTISSWALRLIQIQLAIVYLTTAWHKWAGSTWRNGTATFISSQLREFERFPMPPQHYTQPFIAIETYGTLIVEVALATLVFSPPMRKWVLLGGLILHLGIEYSMNIPFFAAVITAGYIAHYRGEEVEAWLKAVRSKVPFLPQAPAPANPDQPNS